MSSLKEIEQEFDVFFKGIGYFRVDHDIGKSPDFQNADYICKPKRAIVELKILEKEFFHEGGIIDSLGAFIIQPVSTNKDGTGHYTFQIPKSNREGKNDNFEEPLRRTLKKANKQIKETKNYYFPSMDSAGFVMMAQSGLQSLSPVITAKLIIKILNEEFKSIDGAIVSAMDQFLDPITKRKNPLCVSITKENNPAQKKRCMEIADLWAKYLQAKLS